MREKHQPAPDSEKGEDRVMTKWEKLQFVYELKLRDVMERMPDAPAGDYEGLRNQKEVLEKAIQTLEQHNSKADGGDQEEPDAKVAEAIESVSAIL